MSRELSRERATTVSFFGGHTFFGNSDMRACSPFAVASMLGLPTVQGALTPPARTLLQEWADSRDDQLSNHSLSAQGSSSTWRPNVLYLIADDLRTELGAYGQKHIRTPHLDKLAAGGLLFDRAYCQQAICGPSRNSFLTGRRPDSIRVWNFRTDFRQTSGDSVVTLPQLFRNNGYHTAFSGKIFHDDLPQAQDPPSWTIKSRVKLKQSDPPWPP